MQKFKFYDERPYVEYFWNHILGKKELGKIYTHVITSTDAFEWDDLHPGDTLHMMAQESKFDYWVVTSAISDNRDDTELNKKVSELVAANALVIDEDGFILTYDYLSKIYFGNVDEKVERKFDPIQKINIEYDDRKFRRQMNERFVKEAVVFDKDEMAIISEYQKASQAYWDMLKKRKKT